MRNFNLNREIDISSYLPDYLKNVREMDEIMRIESGSVQEEWQACEDCMNDQFVSEATENGISRRERIVGVTPSDGDTLDDRRFRLLARERETGIYTRRSFEKMLTSLCGGNGYQLQISAADFSVSVKVALPTKAQRNSVEELLERILPYNMEFSVGILYNTWGDLTRFTWKELSKNTWKELKEEVL